MAYDKVKVRRRYYNRQVKDRSNDDQQISDWLAHNKPTKCPTVYLLSTSSYPTQTVTPGNKSESELTKHIRAQEEARLSKYIQVRKIIIVWTPLRVEAVKQFYYKGSPFSNAEILAKVNDIYGPKVASISALVNYATQTLGLSRKYDRKLINVDSSGSDQLDRTIDKGFDPSSSVGRVNNQDVQRDGHLSKCDSEEDQNPQIASSELDPVRTDSKKFW